MRVECRAKNLYIYEKYKNSKDRFKNKLCEKLQKQPPRCVLIKRCSEDLHQTSRRIPIPKCDFSKAAKQLY